MKSIIITKWIEPYKLLEKIKEFYQYKDYTFDGVSKNIEKKNFFKELENSKFALGLYMKNVNKYYLFSRNDEFDIWAVLTEYFEFTQNDFETTQDLELPFNMVDMGKAEAGIIIP